MPELLTLAEICRRSGMDRSALNRYLNAPYEANRALFHGADTHPQYPAESLPLFLRLAEQHAQDTVTPKTLHSRWKEAQGGAGGDIVVPAPVRSSDVVRTSNTEHLTPDTQHLREGARLFAQALAEEAEARGLAMGRDKVLSAEKAAKLLDCTPRGVAYRVKAFEPGKYRYSDIQAYIRTGVRTGIRISRRDGK